MFKEVPADSRDDLHKLSTEALEQRLADLKSRRFSTIVGNTTIEVRDSIPEEITKFEAQGSLEEFSIPTFDSQPAKPDLPVEDKEATAIREINKCLGVPV